MFSSRFHWDFHQNRLTQMLAEKRRAGSPILDLTESNPTHAGLAYPPETMRAFDNPRALDYQPAPAGAQEAREAVAAYYKSGGHEVDASRILLTASTSEAYAYLFKLLANPGDNVLVPRPSYRCSIILPPWIRSKSVSIRSPITGRGPSTSKASPLPSRIARGLSSSSIPIIPPDLT
jgi:aspartate/methionine/tyrosine aminotransferase